MAMPHGHDDSIIIAQEATVAFEMSGCQVSSIQDNPNCMECTQVGIEGLLFQSSRMIRDEIMGVRQDSVCQRGNTRRRTYFRVLRVLHIIYG